MKLQSITRVKGIWGVESPVPGLFAEVIFRTPGKEYRLKCDPKTDEIRLSGRVSKRGLTLVPILEGSYRVEWMWRMTNQQGYSDGFRIQLARKQQMQVFEFIAIASNIQVYEAHLMRCTGVGAVNVAC